ncbi:hypothetical protein F0562_001757 [Nyssa sinensis]|uniref:Uncharacterized protein n=1 Tax=Nyssa sinensis TaxID=561372 RepID=A0A5J5C3W6_9ASTE|nr:hypothetical protein F0562_001757 [Nyssa sinensis]
MFEICGKYKHIDVCVKFDETFVPLDSVGSGGSSFVRVGGGGYASAKGGRYTIAIGGEFASVGGGGVASARGGHSNARGGGVVSARGGRSATARGGFATARCGGFARVVSNDDDSMFTINSSDEEYMCNSEEMVGNHSSGNDDENYKDEDWQDKDDGYISNYKSNDNCGAYSSNDDGQTRMTDRYLKGKVFEWNEREKMCINLGML